MKGEKIADNRGADNKIKGADVAENGNTVIAIDGPAASGKTTIGQLLATKIGYVMMDTGFMYRAATLAALDAGMDIGDETAVTALAHEIRLDVRDGAGHKDGRLYSALLNDRDVTWQLRDPAVARNVSAVSSYLGVRQALVEKQRRFGERGEVVMVGRDIGTVVFPDAQLKLYITATAEERARRRALDNQSQGHDSNFEAILADIRRRDAFDSQRKHSPLLPAADAITIDSSNLTPDESISQIMELLNN